MSPHAVNSFVTDLVAMAQAMERVPQLEEAITVADKTNADLSERILDLEISLEASRTYATGLEQKVHNAEVARDDAEMRFLEADDKALTTLASAKAARASLDQMIGLLDPPKPEPVAEPTPTVSATVEGQSEALPTANSSPPAQSASASTVGPQDTAPITTSDPKTVGEDVAFGYPSNDTPNAPPSQEVTQAQADPLPSSSSSGSTSSTEDLPNTPDQSAPAVDAHSEPGPYASKFYYDEPRFIPLEVWLAGGGTVYSYHWRPEQKHLY